MKRLITAEKNATKAESQICVLISYASAKFHSG